MKKRLIYISMAMMALFASCSEDDRIDQYGEGNAIVFGDLKANTRAEITEANQITEFGVFAEMNLGADDTPEETQYINLLSNERVYRANGSWQYDNKRYWVNNRTFHFFAVYPMLDNSKITSFESGAVSNNPYTCYKIDWDTPSAADKDLMTASATVNTTDGQTEYLPVNFQFEHALAKVNINVTKAGADDNNKVVVRSVSIKGIKNNGAYNSNGKWEVNDIPTMNVASAGNLNVELKDEAQGSTPVFGNMLLIPQTIATSAIQISITYLKYDGEGDSAVYEDIYTATGYLPEGNWSKGQIYTYNITLQAQNNEILFSTPDVKPWDRSKPVGGTIIIQ